jgi:L-asparaginase
MKIKIFTTGGTIDKIYFDAKSQYEVGMSCIDTILREGGVSFTYEIESLLRKDSLDITEEDRAFIKSRVAADPTDKILITHGTDTMVETARVLSTIPHKTIVLTGSLSPATFKVSDAPFNVGCALGALQTLPPGTYIAINGKVFNPFNVRKNRELNQFEPVS